MEDNKWSGFMDDPRFRIQDLGRPAFFLIPLKKLKRKVQGETINRRLHRFLVTHFEAYTTALVPSHGIWKDVGKKMVLDKCRQYKVSFEGKDRIPLLMAELAEIATLVGEDCIYFEAGQYACLINPPR
jgi:hypothetical protein